MAARFLARLEQIFRSSKICPLGLAYFCLLGTLTAHQDIDLQVASLTEKIAAQPDDPDLYHRRAELHRAHQEPALALADYDRAIKLSPTLAASHIGRSSTLLDTGKPRQALTAADLAATIEPDSPAAHLARARALAALDRSEAADKAYLRVTSLHQSPSPELYIEHATALINQTPPDLARATEVLANSITAIGPVVTLVSPAIELQLQSANPTAALALCDKLPEGLANTPLWLVRRGDILAALGRINEAHQAYRTAHQAIAKLPERRRKTAAMTALLSSIQDAVARLKENQSVPR